MKLSDRVFSFPINLIFTYLGSKLHLWWIARAAIAVQEPKTKCDEFFSTSHDFIAHLPYCNSKYQAPSLLANGEISFCLVPQTWQDNTRIYKSIATQNLHKIPQKNKISKILTTFFCWFFHSENKFLTVVTLKAGQIWYRWEDNLIGFPLQSGDFPVLRYVQLTVGRCLAHF